MVEPSDASAQAPANNATTTTAAATTDDCPQSESPQQIYDRYAQLQKELARNFQRELAKATGVDGSENAGDELGSEGGEDDDTKQAQPAGSMIEINDDDSSKSSDDDLPPEADPDKPAESRAKGANAAGKSRRGKKQVPNGRATARNGPARTRSEQLSQMQMQRLKLAGMPGDVLNPNGTLDEGEEDEEDKTPRVRASKLEFKRLDELYNKAIHDFYLAESNVTASGKVDKWEEYLFVVRRRFDWQNKFQKTYVDFKSVELRNVLRDVFKDVKGIALREDKPTVEPNLLFNYLGDFEQHLEKAKAVPEESQNKTLIDHLQKLIEYITSDYSAIAKRLYPLLEHHEITFDLLWALFLPNTLIYTVCAGSGEPRCLKLDWGEQKETMDRGRFFQLECHYVDFDGKTFGEANAVLEIDEFRGSRRIDTIGAFPLQYHEEEEELREKLIERGRKFGQLKGMHHKFYKGLAFFKRKRGVVKLNVNGRIMVDTASFRRINPNYRMSPVKDHTHSHGGGGMFGNDDDSDNDGDEDDEDREDEDDEDDINSSPLANGAQAKVKSAAQIIQRTIGKKPTRSYVVTADGKIKLIGGPPGGTTLEKLAAIRKAQQAKEGGATKDALQPETMTEEELLLCSPTVLGFSFGDKLWAEFAVAHIKEIEFNPAAFESLVLPENQKTIVRALVESHTGKEGRKAGIDDVIKGKGKGLVAVLHGRPGVGKTLTAEGISEYLKRPLYMVSAGELGTDSRTLEVQLTRILDVAHVWGAVLLLDEADIFLERRSVHDLHRNALVSIFLRKLEYFEGILFLTTNRVETFDEAFQSRIHIALRYNDLDRKAKRIIWKTFLDMAAQQEASEAGKETKREILTTDELDRLSRSQLNGRQIKNAVRTAQDLAATKKEDLRMVHIETVLGVTEAFERDLKGTGQLDSMNHYS